MRKQYKTFSEYAQSNYSSFAEKLKKNGKSRDEIENIFKSGYYLPDFDIYGNGNNGYFRDSYYGHGFTCDFRFSDNLLDKEVNMYEKNSRIITNIHSIADAVAAVKNATKKLNPEIAKRICFRGQCRKHTIRRPVPNPYYSYSDGSELLMLPAYWRQFEKNEYMDRPLHAEYRSTLGTLYSDPILYDGIDINKLSAYNHKTYGPHTMSELADFPEPENQELYRRYQSKIHNAYWTKECVSLEQHYGFTTPHLDVTFDLPTALFFALNRYISIDANIPSATYRRDEQEESEPTVFCFLFPREDVYYERDMITGYNMFDTTPPRRPLQQKCAVFWTDGLEINWATKHVILELKLDRDFNTEGIPTYNNLFPSPEHDIFYAKLLEQKKLHPDIWQEIIEYQF